MGTALQLLEGSIMPESRPGEKLKAWELLESKSELSWFSEQHSLSCFQTGRCNRGAFLHSC